MNHQQHPPTPPASFVERMSTFDDEDVHIAIRTSIQHFRGRLFWGKDDINRRLVFSDLQQAMWRSATIKQRYNALWRLIPYLKAMDIALGKLTTKPIWTFLVGLSHEMGYITDDEMERVRQNPLYTPVASGSTSSATPRRQSRTSQTLDWVGDIGEIIGDGIGWALAGIAGWFSGGGN